MIHVQSLVIGRGNGEGDGDGDGDGDGRLEAQACGAS